MMPNSVQFRFNWILKIILHHFLFFYLFQFFSLFTPTFSSFFLLLLLLIILQMLHDNKLTMIILHAILKTIVKCNIFIFLFAAKMLLVCYYMLTLASITKQVISLRKHVFIIGNIWQTLLFKNSVQSNNKSSGNYCNLSHFIGKWKCAFNFEIHWKLVSIFILLLIKYLLNVSIFKVC